MNVNAVSNYKLYSKNNNFTATFGRSNNNYKVRKENLKNKILYMQKHGDNLIVNIKELLSLVAPENITFAEKMLNVHNNANNLHSHLRKLNSPNKEMNLARINVAEAMLDSGKFEPFSWAAPDFETILNVTRNANDAENIKKLCKMKNINRSDISKYSSTKMLDAVVSILENHSLTNKGKQIILNNIKDTLLFEYNGTWI